MKFFTDTSVIAHFLCLQNAPKVPFDHISVDSRQIRDKGLFFALKGERVDGHAFVEEAFSNGASCAVVSEEYESCSDRPLIRVKSVLESMQALAKKELEERNTQIIAVTGSVGKTTTKEMIFCLLKDHLKVACSPGNQNSQIGLPLTVFNHTDGEEQFLILEMGMTGKGHIENLVTLAPPTYSVITYVGLVHAEFFDGIEGIARAKGEIFSNSKTKKGYFPENIACRSILEQIGSCEKISVPMNQFNWFDLPFQGDHFRQNFLLAAAVAIDLGINQDQINAAIPNLQMPSRRQQHVKLQGITFIDDSYNASLPSMVAAFQAMPNPEQGAKKIAVVGEMLQLGKFSKECHEEAAKVALEKVDHLFCLGEQCAPMVDVWKSKGRDVTLFSDRASLVSNLKKVVAPGDVVLLKGSNSKQLWKVLDEV